MATDGVFTVTSPNYPTEVAATAFDETKENFEWIRRFMMNSCLVPIHGVVIRYFYTSDRLTSMTFSGTLTGTVAFTYDHDYNIETEVWTLYGKVITYTHAYTGTQLDSTTISIS